MAELSQKERLQPSLLDRLTDNEPGEKKESREQRVLSTRQLRVSVLRDIAWLLNATALNATTNLDPYPQVEKSTLNYGLPDLSGHTVSGIDLVELEKLLRETICDFEPRILRNSLKVRLTSDEQAMSHNAMRFDIEGKLWAQPLPLQVYMRTEVDLESGTVAVSDVSGRGA